MFRILLKPLVDIQTVLLGPQTQLLYLLQERIKMTTIFTGDYDWMKNGYPCSVMYEGMTYPSVEHAFQASKTESMSDRERIANANSPKEALDIGRSVELAPGWGKYRLQIMEYLLNEKYKRNPKLTQLLIDTGNDPILANMGNDFWGTGYDGDGANHLGRLHEKIRSEIQIANGYVSDDFENENTSDDSGIIAPKPLKQIEKKAIERAVINTAAANKPEKKFIDESFGINNSSLTEGDIDEFNSWLK